MILLKIINIIKYKTFFTWCTYYIQEKNIQDILKKKPDGTHLLNLLAPAAAKWEVIGKGLKVDDGTIQSTLFKPQTDINKLSDMFTAWRNTLSSEITWDNVINVLESASVGRHDIAKKIREFLSVPKNYDYYMNQT